MSTSSFTPEELRAAAAVHDELGPDYRDAVVDSFLEKVGREIDARVDARLSGMSPGQVRGYQQAHPVPRDRTFPLAVISMVLGIPITAIVVRADSHSVGLTGLFIVWLAIVIINVASSLHHRQRPGGRQRD